VDHEGIAVAYVVEQGLELGASGVLPGGAVGEYAVGAEVFELALGVLVVTTHPDVPDSLTFTRHATSRSVRMRSKTMTFICQEILLSTSS
jgi:hypothetical protein